MGTVGTGTLSHDLNRWWHKVRGKEDPYLKIGETNNQQHTGKSDYVWPLRNITLDVFPGEVLGIIGKNGAGKSTLLKLLSRITAPSEGSIKTRGRIASLLEVGTGFHPELTGRENIFLNGAILGMSKKEITNKFDEIVDFAGCKRYIDTPVKRYSSGMYVRLAFAVAAHLEPEILVVDEVLAVGDTEFQLKAIEKMKSVSTQQGRTILFVSHNMENIKSLCTRAVVLENGGITFEGTPNECINHYLRNETEHSEGIIDSIIWSSENISVERFTINGKKQKKGIVDFLDPICQIEIQGSLIQDSSLSMELIVSDDKDNKLFYFSPGTVEGLFTSFEKGNFKLSEKICFPTNLMGGEYFFNLNLIDDNLDIHLKAKRCYTMTYSGPQLSKGENNYRNKGFISLS